MPKKQFIASWCAGTFHTKETKKRFAHETVGVDLFCDGNGYDGDEIVVIGNLNVGDIFRSKHYGDYHKVMRIK